MAFVPSASAFSLPLPQWQQPPSLRVEKYESRKRKNQYDTGEEDSDDHPIGGEDGETTDAVSDFGLTDPSVILSPEEVRQYRVAGLSFNENLPSGQFPHGPVKERSRKVNNQGSVSKQLSALSPPIYIPQSAAHQGNLRLHHLAVLTSVLHRCLLDGDYIRAGRAWGLIIREQFGGKSIDVRSEDRWGIGAEILLRKDRQMTNESPGGGTTSSDDPARAGASSKLLFTRKGFEDAKAYYETLIIQHPYQKTAPNATSALHFYPAMFGLWIYVAQEESEAARKALDEQDPAEIRETLEDEDIEGDDRDDWLLKHQRLTAGIRTSELAEADRIAARMDGILTSPPYSDSPELLELRGMVSLWIADLLVSSLPFGDNDDDASLADNDDDVFMSTAQSDGVEARRERRIAMEKKQSEISRSKEFMDKAQQRRRGVSSRLKDLHLDEDMSSRQALAEQARVEVPQAALVAPIPISANRQAPVTRYGSPFRDEAAEHAERPVHRDAFDTDVEAIDESTIAATSVMGGDDIPYRMSPTLRANANGTLQRLNFEQAEQPLQPQPEPQPSQSPSPTRQLRPGRRSDSKWYEGLGDRALKSAGFDLDDLDDVSQLTSTAGDDEQSNDTDDQRFVPRYRAGEEPLSRRLQNFWSASRRTTYHPDTSDHTEPAKAQSYIPVASASKPLPVSSRKVTLPRNMTATPRTRFSPPKPSLLDQLDLTPTRRSPGLSRKHSQKEKDRSRDKDTGKTTDAFLRNHGDGLGLFNDNDDDNNHALGHAEDSLPSLNVFDMTNFDDLENDSSMNDPFSRRTSIRRVGTDTSLTHANTISNMNANSNTNIKSKKRHLEPDYPPEILCTKTFTELQAEPFDKTPNPKTSKPTPAPSPTKEKDAHSQQLPEQGQDEDKISFLLRLSDQERGEYFSKLSMDEWEGCGDLLIEEFSNMMIKMKDLRHARRRMAAVFEAEVKRRNDVVEEQSAEITSKFDEMRAGGAEVLRGRSP
ncbi:extracellular mutant protein 11-domain-containing protein [Aspergillus unguis]